MEFIVILPFVLFFVWLVSRGNQDEIADAAVDAAAAIATKEEVEAHLSKVLIESESKRAVVEQHRAAEDRVRP